MRSTNELLETLRQKALKEQNSLKNVRFSNVIYDLFDLIYLYTNDPYFTFTGDEAQLLFDYIRSKNYDNSGTDLKQDLKFIDHCIYNESATHR